MLSEDKFSSFLARYLHAGLYDRFEDRSNHLSFDNLEGLDQDLQPEPKRDNDVMVAVQWILLAGRKVSEECFTKLLKGIGPDEWSR